MNGSTPIRLGTLVALLLLVPPHRAAAQSTAELSRLVSLYRNGSAESAITGLLALSRTAETFEQRALVEYHLGLALMRTRSPDGAAALRRSIAIDPDLRPDAAATAADWKMWEDVRARMAVPTGIRFEPASTIPGTADSIGLTVEVPALVGSGQPRVRVLVVLPQGRDPVELWSGFAGDRGMWDGSFRGATPEAGTFPLIVEVFSERDGEPIRWRRSLQLSTEPVPQQLTAAPRPPSVSAMQSIRVRDADRQKRVRRRGAIWSVGGSIVAFTATRMVPDVIKRSAPNSAPRIALASVYSAGLVGAFYGATKVAFSARRSYQTTVLVPDEAVLQRQRYLNAIWQADSARVASFNARRESLRRVTVQLGERR